MNFFYHTVIPRILRSLKPLARGIFFLSAMLPAAGKAPANEPDSSVVKMFPQVEVTAERLSSPALEFSPVAVMSGSTIEMLGAGQVADAIAFVPGVYIRNYGGPGGMKTLSVRGATSSQTVVMIDGMRINSSQSGMFDLSMLPAGIVDRMEVSRGGNSSLYGGGAIGGAVNLLTAPCDTARLGISLKYGSFGDADISGDLALPIGNANLGLGLFYQSSKGDYPFDYNRFGRTTEEYRQNADFSNIVISPKASTELGGWLLKAVSFLRAGEKGSPGAVLQGRMEQDKARVNEREALVILSGKKNVFSRCLLNSGILGKVNGFSFRDPDGIGQGGKGIDNFYTNREIRINSSMSYSGSEYTFEGNAEAGYADLRGDMLQPEAGHHVSRTNIALATRAERCIDLGSAGTLRAEAGLRIDGVSKVGGALSPLAGLYFMPRTGNSRIKAQYTRNFRPPGFNEMYYLNFGSADLKPEYSDSYTIGTEIFPFRRLKLQVDGYYSDTRNKIVATPKNQISWSAHNLGKSRAYGVECAASASLFDNSLFLSLNYTRQKTEDRTKGSPNYGKAAEYVPEEILSAMVSWRFGNLTTGANCYYSSYRYSLPSGSYDSMLPGYATAGIWSDMVFPIMKNIKFRAEINNIFDKKYEIVKNYPMPGRSYRIGTKFEL